MSDPDARETPSPGDSFRERPGRRPLLAITFGLSVFLAVRSASLFARYVWSLYREFGFYSIETDFHLWRFILLSLMPLAFNAAFGSVFGMNSHRSADSDASPRGGAPARSVWRVFMNRGLLGVLGWWLLFCLPVLLGGDAIGLLVPSRWPPQSFLFPIRLELALFYPMGGAGLLLGFFSGVLVAEVRDMRGRAPGRKSPWRGTAGQA
ncbi:MAG TPA: hypothetical protein VM492_18885 [Sumerlaeia bacterium]|nr:hypothetical protein [Sumerlaeia bacterium]